MITSLNNAKVKHLVELQQKKKIRYKEELFIVEGLRIFEEVPDNLIKEVYVEEGTYAEIEKEGRAPSSHLKKTFDKITVLKKKGVYVEELSHEVFKKASDTDTPQGVIAVVNMPKWTTGDVVSNVPKGARGNILLLEDIQDPGNLGTMVRTAEAAGMSGIILSESSVDIFNPKTVRSTMGTIFRVPIVYTKDFLSTIDLIKRSNIKVYATSLNAKCDYDKIKYEGRSGILIGNEGNGLSDEAIKKADIGVIIPMCGKVESLNASVAAALMMYAAR